MDASMGTGENPDPAHQEAPQEPEEAEQSHSPSNPAAQEVPQDPSALSKNGSQGQESGMAGGVEEQGKETAHWGRGDPVEEQPKQCEASVEGGGTGEGSIEGAPDVHHAGSHGSTAQGREAEDQREDKGKGILLPSGGGAPGDEASGSSSKYPPLIWKQRPCFRISFLRDRTTEQDIRSLFGNYAVSSIAFTRQGHEPKAAIVRLEHRHGDEQAAVLQELYAKKVRGREVRSSAKTLNPNWVLFAGNLPCTVGDDALRRMFEPYGKIDRAFVVRDPDGRSKRFGFVEFTLRSEANRALNAHRYKETPWVDLARGSDFNPLLAVSLCARFSPNLVKREESLMNLFRPYGKVSGRYFDLERGFAFVKFSTSVAADHAWAALDGCDIGETKLKVFLANPGKNAQYYRPKYGATPKEQGTLAQGGGGAAMAEYALPPVQQQPANAGYAVVPPPQHTVIHCPICATYHFPHSPCWWMTHAQPVQQQGYGYPAVIHPPQQALVHSPFQPMIPVQTVQLPVYGSSAASHQPQQAEIHGPFQPVIPVQPLQQPAYGSSAASNQPQQAAIFSPFQPTAHGQPAQQPAYGGFATSQQAQQAAIPGLFLPMTHGVPALAPQPAYGSSAPSHQPQQAGTHGPPQEGEPNYASGQQQQQGRPATTLCPIPSSLPSSQLQVPPQPNPPMPRGGHEPEQQPAVGGGQPLMLPAPHGGGGAPGSSSGSDDQQVPSVEQAGAGGRTVFDE